MSKRTSSTIRSAERRQTASACGLTLEEFRALYRVDRARPPHGTRYAWHQRWADGRRIPYDPWLDLALRLQPGVPYAANVSAIEFFAGSDEINHVGLTVWSPRKVIRLNSDQSEAQLRTTLTHELLHCERGRVPRELQDAEEDAVELLTAQRLIDPDLFDAGADAHVLRVDEDCMRRYAEWRQTVSAETAAAAWESATWGMPRPASWRR